MLWIRRSDDADEMIIRGADIPWGIGIHVRDERDTVTGNRFEGAPRMTDATPTAEDIIEVMRSRFRSCNGIEVERAHLKKDEWEALLTSLSAHAAQAVAQERERSKQVAD